jgi:hypothetical protein
VTFICDAKLVPFAWHNNLMIKSGSIISLSRIGWNFFCFTENPWSVRFYWRGGMSRARQDNPLGRLRGSRWFHSNRIVTHSRLGKVIEVLTNSADFTGMFSWDELWIIQNIMFTERS